MKIQQNYFILAREINMSIVIMRVTITVNLRNHHDPKDTEYCNQRSWPVFWAWGDTLLEKAICSLIKEHWNILENIF